MPWLVAMLRNRRVLARCNDEGRLQIEGGRVEIRYRANDGRAYRASPRNLTPVDGEAILPDSHCGEAEPVQRSKRSGGKRASEKAVSTPALPEVPRDAIVAYTDGACSGNPGPAGLGVVLDEDGRRRELSEYLGQGTNNIAELTAVLRAVEAIGVTPRPVRIFTDSRYAIGVLTQGWKARANATLVQRLRGVLSKLEDLQLIYVRGHAGIELNERADELARQAISDRETSGWRPAPT